MSNSFYNKTNAPSPNSPGSSAQIRNEFDLVYQAFNKMPVLSLANANKLVAINSTGNGLTQVNSLTGIGGIDNTPIGATTPSTGSFTNLLASGVVNLGLAVAIGGGTINNSIIGGVTPNSAYFTTAAASSGFTGNLTGNVTGNLTGNVAGNVTGNIASSGTSTFNNLTITGTLDMSSGTAGTITGLSAPTNASDAATKQYVDTADALKLNLAGGTMSGEIAMGGNRITGMANPSSAQDAATKTYVDIADALKLNLSGGTLTGGLAMSGNKITGLGTPTASTDAANKAYVDNAIQGLDAKASVRVASTANLNLTGTQTVDGVALVVGDRVLVKNQDTPAANGLYTVSSGTWTRTTDGDTWDELVAAYVFVEDGTTNGRNGFLCTITQGGTIGVTSISWVQFNSAGQIDAGNGLTKTGNRLDVATASADRIVVNPDNIDLAVTGISAGTYKSVTVDIYGRVVSGGNPNSLSGYGITDAYSKTEADLLYDAKLSRSGGTMTGAIAMGNNKITGLGTPTANGDAATKLYADGKLALTGGTMSGAITMGSNKITGLADPTAAQDAVTLNYVTTLYGSTASAATSASAAATSEANALNYKNAAGVSASDAASSATAAAASYDAFDDRYLGSKTSDPTTDNDGNALIDGALYWNSTLGLMKAYKLATTSWILAYVPSDFYVAKSGDTITGNLTLSSGTANGVAYLNGSKVLTTGSALTFDGTLFNLTGNSRTSGYSLIGAPSLLVGGEKQAIASTTTDTYSSWQQTSGITAVFGVNGTGAYSGSFTNQPYVFRVNNTEQMRLTSTGLGIGTSSPGSKLTVAGVSSIYTSSNANTGSGYVFSITGANNKTSSSDSTQFALFSNDALASNPLTLVLSTVGNATVANGYAYLQASEYGTGNWRSLALQPYGGNVGIGTSSPGSKLHVASAGSVGSRVENTLNNGAAYLQAKNTAGSTYLGQDSTGGYLLTDYAAPILFYTNNTERMRLDSSGNLGLGVTPSAWSGLKGLQNGRASLAGQSSEGAWLTNNAFYNGTNWVYMTSSQATMYQQLSGVQSWHTAPSGTAGNAISFTQAMTLDASGNLIVAGTSALGATSGRGNITLNGSTDAILSFGNAATLSGYILSAGSGMYFDAQSTRPLIFSNNSTERMRIDSSGNLLVGKTSAGIANNGIELRSDNEVYITSLNTCMSFNRKSNGVVVNIYNSGSQAGSITVSGTTTAYNTFSDYRLKENIQPMQNALGVVAQLNPVTYNWKADGSDGQGFIAHELQAVVPDCVTGEKDAVDKDGKPVYQGVDTSFLVGILTKAIQEQQQLIEALTARVAQLEGQ